MEFHQVIEVLDINMIAVWPPWRHNGKQGQLVRIEGLSLPKGGAIQRDIARCKLRFLLAGSCIRLSGNLEEWNGVLKCEVSYSGRNLTDHLYEYALEQHSDESGRKASSPGAAFINFEEVTK